MPGDLCSELQDQLWIFQESFLKSITELYRSLEPKDTFKSMLNVASMLLSNMHIQQEESLTPFISRIIKAVTANRTLGVTACQGHKHLHIDCLNCSWMNLRRWQNIFQCKLAFSYGVHLINLLFIRSVCSLYTDITSSYPKQSSVPAFLPLKTEIRLASCVMILADKDVLFS